MKKISIALIILSIFTAAVFAETYYEPPFLPVSPEVMAQGGSYTAIARGYNSLFYNPAGFADEDGDLTLLSTSAWIYANPAAMGELFSAETTDAIAQSVSDQITTGGLGVGASVGLGLVSGGLGIGGAVVIDSSLFGGRNVLDLSGDVHATVGLVGGYALDLNLLGLNWKIGADLRPMYRIHAPVTNAMALDIFNGLLTGNPGEALAVLNSQNALSGVGVGIDIGTIVELGPVIASLSIRDLFGTEMNYKEVPFEQVVASLEGGPEPEGTEVSDVYKIPMDVSAGVAFHPDLGALSWLLDPTVHADIQDVVGVIANGRSPWTLIHIGADVKILKMFSARAGFNQGYITAGVGAHLLFLDLNAAFFTRELGKYIGDTPNSGATIELAVRL